MTKKHFALGLAAFGVLLAILFFTKSPEAPDGEAVQAETPPIRTEEEAADRGHDEPELDVRVPAEFKNPAYQQPAEDPLVRIVAQTTLLPGSEGFMAPRVSADGKHLIITGESYEGLWVANIDGTGLKQISDGRMAGWRPVSTTHGELIFRTGEFDETANLTFRLHVYDFETGETRVIYEGVNEDVYPAQLTKDEDYVLIRSDGQIIPYQLRDVPGLPPLHERDEGFAYSDFGQVWYKHLSMDEPMPLSSDTQATGGEEASPTGSHVAYLSGNTASALIVDLETGAEVDIGGGSNLSWSPDGGLLLYDVTSDNGHEILDSQIFVVQADGANAQRVTFVPGSSFINPRWGPDGSYFVATNLTTGDVVRFDLEVRPGQASTQ